MAVKLNKQVKAAKSSTVTLECVRAGRQALPSSRTARVALQFGLPLTSESERVLEPLQVRLGPGRIALFVGPSGSGKSTALQMIARQCPGGHDVGRIRFAPRRPVVDGICPSHALQRAIELLGDCGLGEARLWVRSLDELSEGQRFRARLARAIGHHMQSRSSAPLICDEFASGLHRRLAQAIAFNLRKLAGRHGLSLVLACSDETIAKDLQPDVIIRLLGGGRHVIDERRPRKRSISFGRRLVIEEGSRRDYDQFASMHYRTTDELGFVAKVFVLREGRGGDLLGIVVYSHGPLELALRNRATNKRFSRNPRRLNREMRIIRRVVVHPDVRGCGLGHRLLRDTLPRVGTKYVECLATMGEFNPVFEKAGMTRIGTCAMPPYRARVLSELAALDVDPCRRDFVMQVSRRPRVRRLVAELVYRWYQATTAGGERRVERQSPQLLAHTFRGLVGSRPVYYLWRRPDRRKR